jgi:hypothetical protein
MRAPLIPLHRTRTEEVSIPEMDRVIAYMDVVPVNGTRKKRSVRGPWALPTGKI